MPNPTPMNPSKVTYVLVHGAWHGGWCWRRLTPLLMARGDTVRTLTLTGLGDRKHLLHKGIDLETHVTDVTAFLEMEDLTEVVLVGHSYAGMVISGAAERASHRIRRLVYFDAFVPSHGQTAHDMIPEAVKTQVEAQARDSDSGYTVDPFPLEFFGLTDPKDQQWAAPRLTPHPIGTYRQPVTLGGNAASLPKSFILCRQFNFHDTAERCRQQGWPVTELNTPHDAMITHPQDLATALLSPENR